MRLSTCITIITLSATFVAARPLNNDFLGAQVQESSPQVEWTDLISSNENKMGIQSTNYKEFPNAADQQAQVDRQEQENIKSDVSHQGSEKQQIATDQDQLEIQDAVKHFQDENNSPSDTEYALDIIMKPDEPKEQQEPYSDTTLDMGTRNAVTKNETSSDTTDYANNDSVTDQSIGIQIADSDYNNKYIASEPVWPVAEQSSTLDFYDALDQALLDPYIEGIDSDMNSEVYEEPVAETTTVSVGQVFDYRSMIAEQISLAEEMIRIKHDELLQDQQQIDDLKRKVHPTPTATTVAFSLQVVESGPNETMYVYKGKDITNQPPLSTETPLLSTDVALLSKTKELETEQNVPSAVINTPIYNLEQKQIDQDESKTVVDLVTHMGDTATFDPSNKLKLPNGNWTPSCKNVSKGLYCLKPDGQGATIIECSGENVGFEFSCGKDMLCYSTGPFDVDCQKEQDFIIKQ